MSYQNENQKSDSSKSNKQDECCKTNQKQTNQKENRKDMTTNKKGDC